MTINIHATCVQVLNTDITYRYPPLLIIALSYIHMSALDIGAGQPRQPQNTVLYFEHVTVGLEPPLRHSKEVRQQIQHLPHHLIGV